MKKERAKLIAENERISYWKYKEDVYRVNKDKYFNYDSYGNPCGMRWECTFEHWNKFRAIYDFVKDVA